MKLTRSKEAMLLSIYFEKRACRKLKTLITKPWVSNDGLRTVSTSKAEVFVTITNWLKLLAVATKSSILLIFSCKTEN